MAGLGCIGSASWSNKKFRPLPFLSIGRPSHYQPLKDTELLLKKFGVHNQPAG